MRIAKPSRPGIGATAMATRCSSSDAACRGNAVSFPRMRRPAVIALALLLGIGRAAGAQAPPPAARPAPSARPRVVPVRVDVPPIIDGRLDDPAWKTAV